MVECPVMIMLATFTFQSVEGNISSHTIQCNMKRFLFVGEERSPTAIRMGVTWKDKRLAAAHLSKAVEALGIDWDKCTFLNVFEDDVEKIRNFRGVRVAMGRKVERELKKHEIKHEYIHHPAARGKIRIIENYKAHVKEQLKSVI